MHCRFRDRTKVTFQGRLMSIISPVSRNSRGLTSRVEKNTPNSSWMECIRNPAITVTCRCFEDHKPQERTDSATAFSRPYLCPYGYLSDIGFVNICYCHCFFSCIHTSFMILVKSLMTIVTTIAIQNSWSSWNIALLSYLALWQSYLRLELTGLP